MSLKHSDTWKDRWMEAQTDSRTDMKENMDRRVDRRMDGRTYGWTNAHLDSRRVGGIRLSCQVSLLLPLPELPEVILDQERCVELTNSDFLLCRETENTSVQNQYFRPRTPWSTRQGLTGHHAHRSLCGGPLACLGLAQS